MTAVGWRDAHRADRHDDPQPHVGDLGVAPTPHLLHLLPRLCRGFVAVLLNPKVSCADDVKIGRGHTLFDHLVGAGEDGGRYTEVKGLGGLEIDRQVEPRRPLNR
jgi:hypothetical protein